MQPKPRSTLALKEQILSELDQLIAEAERLDQSFKMEGMGGYASPIPEHEHRALVTGALAAVARIAGADSEYYKTIRKPDTDERISVAGPGGPKIIPSILGSLKALRTAVEAGLLRSIEVRLRAAIHDDLLVQSEDLNQAGYHAAAIVLAGGVLENHLRSLCETRELEWRGSGSISKYNDLLRGDVYPQSTWRRIQSVADVRNEAAHGNGQAIQRDEVTDAIPFVLRVIDDYPS